MLIKHVFLWFHAGKPPKRPESRTIPQHNAISCFTRASRRSGLRAHTLLELAESICFTRASRRSGLRVYIGDPVTFYSVSRGQAAEAA